MTIQNQRIQLGEDMVNLAVDVKDKKGKDKWTLKPPSIVDSMKNLLLKVEVPRGQRAIDVVNNMLLPT